MAWNRDIGEWDRYGICTWIDGEVACWVQAQTVYADVSDRKFSVRGKITVKGIGNGDHINNDTRVRVGYIRLSVGHCQRQAPVGQ